MHLPPIAAKIDTVALISERLVYSDSKHDTA